MAKVIKMKVNLSTKISAKKLLVIAAVLQIVWGLVPSASKRVIDEIPVELYIAVRWSISGLIFAAYLLFSNSWKRVSFKDIAAVSLLGILGYGIASLAALYGLKLGGVTNFALMGAISPAVTSLVAILILRERPSRSFFLALPISVLGLVFLVAGKYQLSTFEIAGSSTLLILFGYFLEGLVFVFSKKFKRVMGSAQYIAIAQIATATLLWTLQIKNFHQIEALKNLTTMGILAALFVSIVACVLCYAILYWLLNHIEGHRLALFDGFHTLSATVFGCILLSEKINLLMIVGGLLILLALIWGNLPRGVNEEIPES